MSPKFFSAQFQSLGSYHIVSRLIKYLLLDITESKPDLFYKILLSSQRNNITCNWGSGPYLSLHLGFTIFFGILEKFILSLRFLDLPHVINFMLF